MNPNNVEQEQELEECTDIQEAADTFLTSIRSVSYQGWAIIYVLLCGSYTTWATKSTFLAHVFPFTIGYIFTTMIAFCFTKSFLKYLRHIIIIEYEYDVGVSYEHEAWNAIRGICQLGFVGGYLGAHGIFTNNRFIHWAGLYAAFVLYTLVREYNRTSKRKRDISEESSVGFSLNDRSSVAQVV